MLFFYFFNHNYTHPSQDLKEYKQFWMLNLSHLDINVECFLHFESCPGDFMWYILQSCSKHSIVQNKITICSFDVIFYSVCFMLICSKKDFMHVHYMKIEAFEEKKKGISTKTEIQLNWIILIMRLTTNFAKCFSFLNLNIPTKYIFTNLVKVS